MANSWGLSWGSSWGDSWGVSDSGSTAIISNTKEFTLTAQSSVVVRQLLPAPSTKEFTLTPTTEIVVNSDIIASITAPKQFTLTPQPITLVYDVFKTYTVATSTPFRYSLVGVNYGCVQGEGFMEIYVNGVLVAGDLEFNQTFENVALSGIIIPRGAKIEIGLLIVGSDNLQSFNADFALKRI